MLRRVLAWYAGLLQRAPLRTNLCTASPLMAVGDATAQRLEGGDRPLDVQRTTTMVAYSALVFTPLFFYLYRWQDRVLRGTPVWLAFQKSLASIVVGGVPGNALFLTLSTTLEMGLFGKRPTCGRPDATIREVIGEKLRTDWLRLMQGSFCFWMPTNMVRGTPPPTATRASEQRPCERTPARVRQVNFYFVPALYRIIFSSGAACGWNCFLSLVQHEYVAGDASAS